MKSDFTMKELQTELTLKCGELGLSYGLNQQPVKIGPDVYMFNATELNEQCRKHGQCRYKKYYALIGREDLVIIDCENDEVMSNAKDQ